MIQRPLTGLEGVGYLKVVTDYGQVGGTASQPHYVLAENMQEYIIKGPEITPSQPYVAVNEWIAARLAEAFGLPILDSRFLEWNGKLYFASAWMTQGTYYPAITEQLFGQCDNREVVYALVVFDAWICNGDRHNTNLLVRKQASGTPQIQHHSIVLNDHGHALLPPGEAPVQLAAKKQNPVANYCGSLQFIRDAIRDAALLRNALDQIERLSYDYIETVVRTVPEVFLQPGDRDMIAMFLLERRTKLRLGFDSERGSFPNLGGGTL